MATLYDKEFTENINIIDENITEALVDSYSESNASFYWTLNSSNGYVRAVGQSFEGNGGVLNSSKFYIKKYGSPTGNAYAQIYAHSGTFGTSSEPTGSALVESDAVDISGISDADYELTEFTFSGTDKMTLINGTKYVLVVYSYNGDSTNRIKVATDNSSPTCDGNTSWLANTDYTWYNTSSQGTIFYLYTDTYYLFFKSIIKEVLIVVTITEGLTKNILRMINESITNTDIFAKATGFLRIFTDTINNSDSLLKSTIKNINEAITITDSKVKSIIKSVSETITTTDTKIRSVIKSLVDSIGLVDSISAVTLFDKPVSYIKKSVITPGIKKLNVTSTVAKNYASSNIVALKTKSKILKDNIISKFK